ncbi:hypothetical protein T07_4621 [Trichinella nelsoni]|uniref:Uncharacterized protein n=1 Tax=Trichinella nelsoni TaxID=6336 RepID=A0A0V0S5U8_9BILA|nr:hypothetical protein T07_4621 [Trichinella nelsoni]
MNAARVKSNDLTVYMLKVNNFLMERMLQAFVKLTSALGSSFYLHSLFFLLLKQNSNLNEITMSICINLYRYASYEAEMMNCIKQYSCDITNMSFYDKFHVDEEERHVSSYNMHCNMVIWHRVTLQLGDSCACFVNSNNEYYSWIKIKVHTYMTLVCAMHYL